MNKILKMWREYRDKRFLARLNRVLANKEDSKEIYSLIKKLSVEGFEETYCTGKGKALNLL